MGTVILPPSPNWYGSHLSDATPRLFAYCGHNAVVVLDTLSLSVVDVLKGHNNRTTAIAFIGSSGNCLISAASDKSVRLWVREGDGEGRFMCRRALGKRPAEVKAITSTSCGGIVVLGDAAGNLFSWDTTTPTEKLHRLDACKRDSPIVCLSPAPGRESCIVAVGCVSGEVSLIDWKRGVLAKLLDRHSAEVQSLRWARLAASSSSNSSDRNSSGDPYSSSSDAQCIDSTSTSISTADVDLLVSTSSDRSIVVYKTEEEEERKNKPPKEVLTSSPEETTEGGRVSSATIVNARVLSKLLLPPPHGGVGKGQKGRLWLPSAWCPVLSHDGLNTNSSAAWLVTGGFGGALFAWKIPLAPPSSPSPSSSSSMPEEVPLRISTVHTRTVFSLHCFLDPGTSLSGGAATTGTSTSPSSPSGPGLHILSIGMDRTAAATWTPLPLYSSTGNESTSTTTTTTTSTTATTIKTVPVAACIGLGAHPQSFAAERSLVALSIDNFPRLAVACGDSTIRILEFPQKPLSTEWSTTGLLNPTSSILLWQGILSPVTSVTWHPIQEDIIVFGCFNGSIGLAHCKRGTCIMAPTKHRGPVTALEWVDAPFPSDEFDDFDDFEASEEEEGDEWEEGDCSLVSFSSAGDVLQWRIWRSLAELFPPARRHAGGAQSQEAPVRRELGTPEDITHDLSNSPIMCLAGSANQHDIAVGGEGGVSIIDQTSQKMLSVRQHPTGSPVVNVSLACATRAVALHADGSLFVAVPRLFGPGDPAYKPVQLPPDITVTALAAYCFPISPDSEDLHVSAALGTKDGSVQLWRAPWKGGVLQHVATLRGHSGTVLKLGWIHVKKITSEPGSLTVGTGIPILLSSAEDQTVRSWDIAAYIAQPPTTEATAAGSSMPAAAAAAAAGDAGHAVGEVNAVEPGTAETAAKEEEIPPPPPPLPLSISPILASEEFVVVEKEGEGEEVAEQSISPQPPLPLPPSNTPSSRSTGGASSIAQKKGAKQLTLGSKSLLLPTKSTSENTAQQEALQAAVVQLAQRAAAVDESGGGSSYNNNSTTTASPMVALGCPLECLDALSVLSHATDALLQQDGLARLAPQQRRLQAHRAAAVALWAGDIGQSIRILCEADALTADFVSFAAGAGRAAWEAVSRSYAAQLEESGEAHLAALYLLSVGDPCAACAVYSRNGMAREAATLAAAKLPASDPETQRLRGVYAAKLEARGEYEYAAGQYLAARQGTKAVQALQKRNTASSLRAAAQLRRVILGEEGEGKGGVEEISEEDAATVTVLGNEAVGANLFSTASGTDTTAGSHRRMQDTGSRRRYDNAEMLAVRAAAARQQQGPSGGKKLGPKVVPPALRIE